MFNNIREGISVARDRDPAALSSLSIFLNYAGLQAIRAHRRQHWYWEHNMKGFARWSAQRTRHRTGIEIHPGATIGKRFFIDHGMGVVIGETTIIGDNCMLYQGVTLGGTGKESGKRHPTLGDNVIVGVGASVLGNVYIGDNSKIGGGAVVVHDVPSNCTVVGIPGHVVRRDGHRVDEEADEARQRHEDLPDPIEESILRMQQQIDELQARLDRAEGHTSGKE